MASPPVRLSPSTTGPGNWPGIGARLIVIAAGTLVVLLQCACGTSQPQFPSLGAGGSGAVVSFAAWDQCLRDHNVSVPAGYDPYNPPAGMPKLSASTSAWNACAIHLPPAPPLPASVRQKWLSFTECMRAHGFDAPDPSFLPDGNVSITYPMGVGPNEPGFTSTQTTCNQQVGLGPTPSPTPSAG